jgi:TetR/AcrR family transcriptional repressor for divergent bdcA
VFHERGYDDVGVAELSNAMGIAPPSFYAAFGSKASLFAKTLERYDRTAPLRLSHILHPERPPAEAITALLVAAAEIYTADAKSLGCLALEGSRCSSPEARAAAEATGIGTSTTILAFLTASQVKPGAAVDLVLVTLAGLSAYARRGMARKQLIAVAEAMAPAISAALAQ